MKITLLIAFFYLQTIVFGQNLSSEQKKAMSKAKFNVEMKDYSGALAIYADIYNKDSTDLELNYQMGLCYFHLNNFYEAEKHFEKTSPSISVELFRYKAAVAHANQKFKKALNFYNGYKLIAGKKELSIDEINRLINQISYAELSLKNKRNIAVENVGETINTKFDDYNPLINADASVFIFTSNKESNKHTIYQSDQKLATVKKLNSTINNTINNNISAGFSVDGQILFTQQTNKFFVGSDLFIAQMGLDEWEVNTKLPKTINSAFNETSASITIDNATIYFSSDKPGGFGGKDIYKTTKLNGEWAEAVNLGPIINSPYDDDAPFFHSDNKTLYFSSKGHQNMGGYDLFKAEFINGSWSNPENLGSPINSVRDETNIVLTPDGKVAFFTSTAEGGFGGKDIYKAIINDPPTNMLILKGTAINSKTKEIVIAKVTLIENTSKKIHGIYKANAKNGEYILLIEPGKTYNVLVEAEGYHPISEELEIDFKKLTPLSFKMELKK